MLTKLYNLMAAMTALAAMPPEDRDEKALQKAAKDLSDLLASDEAKAHGDVDVVKLQADLADTVKLLDEQTEQVKALRRAGLATGGRAASIPAGLSTRREMLRDGRAFGDEETARRFGGWMAAKALQLWGRGADIPGVVREVYDGVVKDLDPDTAAAGGNLIPDEFRPELIRNVEAEGTAYVLARRVPLVSVGSTNWPTRTGGMTAHWTAAGAQGTRSTPSFGLATLSPEKLMVLTAYPNEFARSRLLVALGQYLALELVHAMALALDDAFVNGDGTASYGGITGILNSASIGTVTPADDHDALSEITGTDVGAVIAGLPAGYALNDARWMMHNSVKGTLRNLRSTTGVPLFDRGSGGEPSMIDGYPYSLVNRMPTATTAEAASQDYAVFGDPSLSHLVGMIQDIQIATSDQALFESDLTALRGIMHVDMTEVDSDALVIAATHS